MTLRYAPVNDDHTISILADLADEIWHEYWPALIGPDQTDYMVEQFQSVPALKHDIYELNYLYYLIYDETNTLVGYTGGCDERFEDDPLGNEACKHGCAIAQRSTKRFFISKIYLRREERGKHYASRIIEFWENHARMSGLDTLYLTVNKGNDLGVRAYLGRGFETIEALAAEIGEGFVMDDYIMAKAVTEAATSDLPNTPNLPNED